MWANLWAWVIKILYDIMNYRKEPPPIFFIKKVIIIIDKCEDKISKTVLKTV